MADTAFSLAAQIRALQARMTTLTAATQQRGFEAGYREMDDQREDRVELRERLGAPHLAPVPLSEQTRRYEQGMEY